MKHFFSSPLTGLALIIIVSTSVAIVATVVTNDSLDQYAQRLEQSDTLLRISQQRPDPIPGSYEESLGYVKEQVGDVAFFSHDLPATDLSAEDVVAVGAVITSDGWVLIAGDVDVNLQRVVWVNENRYSIDDLVNMSAFTLVHLDGAASLRPFAFGMADDVEPGERLFALGSLDDFSVTSLVDGQQMAAALARSAADYKQVATWELQHDLRDSLLVNTVGDLVGLVGGGEVYPIHYALPWLQSAIRGEDYVVPRLGVSVRWLDALLVTTVDRNSGALVQTVHTPESPFLVGDVIVRVGNVTIDANTPIAETLLAHDVGDSIAVTIVRDGESQEVRVELLGDSLIY